jgi:hypothetical protein
MATQAAPPCWPAMAGGGEDVAWRRQKGASRWLQEKKATWRQQRVTSRRPQENKAMMRQQKVASRWQQEAALRRRTMATPVAPPCWPAMAGCGVDVASSRQTTP